MWSHCWVLLRLLGLGAFTVVFSVSWTSREVRVDIPGTGVLDKSYSPVSRVGQAGWFDLLVKAYAPPAPATHDRTARSEAGETVCETPLGGKGCRFA